MDLGLLNQTSGIFVNITIIITFIYQAIKTLRSKNKKHKPTIKGKWFLLGFVVYFLAVIFWLVYQLLTLKQGFVPDYDTVFEMVKLGGYIVLMVVLFLFVVYTELWQYGKRIAKRNERDVEE